MQKIQKILELEISEGSIKWPKLQQKIEAALKLTDNKFESFAEETGERINIKLEDAITFRVKRRNGVWCYKLLSPRFKGTVHSKQKGGLFASGIQKGIYDDRNRPIFPFPPVMF